MPELRRVLLHALVWTSVRLGMSTHTVSLGVSLTVAAVVVGLLVWAGEFRS